MHKIKTFNDGVVNSDLDESVNTWLEENPNITVKDIKFSAVSYKSDIMNKFVKFVMIHYEECRPEAFIDPEESDEDETIYDGLDDAIVEGDEWYKDLKPGFERQAYGIKKQMDDEFAKRKGLHYL